MLDDAAANGAELGRLSPVLTTAVKCAPPSVERHTPLFIPVAHAAHTTGGVGAANWQGRPGEGAGGG